VLSSLVFILAKNEKTFQMEGAEGFFRKKFFGKKISGK
jgi:hypothetical protein